MKESLISDSSLTHQWYFNDNMSVVDNYRVKATVQGNPVFNNGIVTLTGSEYYLLKTKINLGKVHSIEVKFKQYSVATEMSLLGGDANNKLSIGTSTLRYKATTEKTIAYTPNLNWNTLCLTRNGDGYVIYMNGVALTTNATGAGTSNFIFNVLGALADFSLKYAGQLEYIKIWNRQLSPAEVRNNYNGKTYKSLPYVSGEILGSDLITNQADREFSSDTGYWSKTSATITIADGVCHFVNTPDGQYLRRLNVLTLGVRYRVRFKVINYVKGLIRDSFGGSLKNSNGIYDYYVNAASTTIGLNNADVSTTLGIEYFYVEEVTQSAKNTLFHINSDTGVIRDLIGKTNPTPTNVQLPKIGSNINVMKFDGSSGYINIGSQALVGDITFMGWTKTIQLGEVSEGTIINNGQYFIRHSASGFKLFVFGRTGVSAASSSILSVKLQQNQFICITSTSTGITNFYIGDKNNPPTLSGTANQSAGTPVAGGTCYLGNRAGDDRTLNGWLNDCRMEQSILTLEEITQHYSATKYKY